MKATRAKSKKTIAIYFYPAFDSWIWWILMIYVAVTAVVVFTYTVLFLSKQVSSPAIMVDRNFTQYAQINSMMLLRDSTQRTRLRLILLKACSLLTAQYQIIENNWICRPIWSVYLRKTVRVIFSIYVESPRFFIEFCSGLFEWWTFSKSPLIILYKLFRLFFVCFLKYDVRKPFTVSMHAWSVFLTVQILQKNCFSSFHQNTCSPCPKNDAFLWL